MHPVPLKGTLIQWNDDRGFGFIAPDDGGPRVFLHIHALPNAPRRPQIGDIITFHAMTQADGRIRATNALIQGLPTVSSQNTPRYTAPRRSSTRFPAWITLAIVAVLGIVTFVRTQYNRDTPTPRTSPQYQTTTSNKPTTLKPQKVTPAQTYTPPPKDTTPATTQANPIRNRAAQKPKSNPAPPPLITEEPPAEIEDPEITDTSNLPTDGGQGPIKGNISYNNNQKLYHMPGMRDYDITIIDPRKGERYFETEDEARAAGWRRAPR